MHTKWPPFQKPSSVLDLRLVQTLTSLLIGNVENNENNRGQRQAGFNPGSINSFITIWDYDEVNDDDNDDEKETLPNFQHVQLSGHPA